MGLLVIHTQLSYFIKMHRIKQTTSVKDEKTVIDLLKYFLLLLRILGVLSNDAKLGDFKWRSWRVLYSLIIIIFFTIALLCCIVYWALHGSTITYIAIGVRYGGALATMLLYLRLAMNWSNLTRSWSSVDKSMNKGYGYPQGLATKINIFTVLFVFLGSMDLSLKAASTYTQLWMIYGPMNMSAQVYFSNSYPQLFYYIPYSSGTAIFCIIMSVHSRLTWALNDVFIIIISTALATRFKQISHKLTEFKELHLDIPFWKDIREDYSRLVGLCKELDSHVSSIVLLSYFLNMFFLLILLYQSLGSMSNTTGKVYFIFSFVYLIFKNVSVSLYAASINDESKEPTTVLISVDSSVYNIEIRRLLTQISFDTTALTGCKMFSIKRGLILSVASALVTYELVLMQFSEAYDAKV